TLDVQVGEGHAVQLEWGFRYPVPTVDGTRNEVRVPLHPAPEDPPRDRSTEARLVESLSELSVIPSLVRRDLSGLLVPLARVSLAGTDTVTFATQVLPRLQSRDDVQVTIHGQLAEYAEAQSPPVVHLETA